jgi:hypothetical protein
MKLLWLRLAIRMGQSKSDSEKVTVLRQTSQGLSGTKTWLCDVLPCLYGRIGRTAEKAMAERKSYVDYQAFQRVDEEVRSLS